MAYVNIDIKPTGLVTSDLVDVLYQWWAAIKGICTKLDADAGVTDVTYVSLCYTAIFNGNIEDSQGNQVINQVTAKAARFYTINPNGVTDEALLECFYDMLDAMHTLAAKLDADCTFTNYEATAYTAVCTQLVENQTGQSVLGNGTAVYKFCPGGVRDDAEIVEFLFNAVEFIHLLTHAGTTTGLDDDTAVTDTNYEALWYTAAITRVIENKAGSTIGNARTF